MRQLHGVDYPASDLADPIVTPQEARSAEPAVCRHHGGLIAHGLSQGDWWGKVMWCPSGKMYWRLTPAVAGMHTPLRYPKGL